MRHSLRLLLATSALAAAVYAVQTKTWSQNDFSEFEKGEIDKLSIASRGRLTLAPVFQEIHDASSPYLWALAVDSKGNVYAGGGGPGGSNARVYMVPPNGKGKVLAELDGLEVHALAVDKKDRVFAATAPDGKVYRLEGGKSEVFYDPKEKYIWAMAFDGKENLYVATGDQGEIHRVTPAGKGDIFFKTGETHARSLAIDARDNLVVGTEPDGLIIRVSPAGEGFVLYQAGKREITAVAVAKDGAIYASAVGNKGGSGLSVPMPVPPPPAPLPAGAPNPHQPGAARQAQPAPAASMPAPPPSVAGGSEVYRIDKDGFPRKVWSHAQHIVYAITFDSDSRPLIGTGNKGTVYRIDSDVAYTLVTTLAPTQVTAIQAGQGGKLYAATGNVGKVYQIGPGIEKEGKFESDPFDAGMFSHWGRLAFRGAANGGQIAIETRTGNLDRPQKDWSPWSSAIVSSEGARISSPPARFIQWRATLRQSPDGRSPDFDAVDVAYMAKNVGPVIEAIEPTPPNYRFQSAAVNIQPSQTINLPPIGKPNPSGPGQLNVDTGGGNSMQAAKGYAGARWAASDENGDGLSFDVCIRGEKETAWKPLKTKIRERYLSWDGTAFADGSYVLRVVASDAPSNTPGQTLTTELTSDPFIIDNTPPAISRLAASGSGNKVTVRWKAVDALSVIQKAEYSLNGAEWIVAEPTTRLSDSKELDYELTLDRAAGSEMTIAVRVTDDHQNQAVDKTVVQ